MTVEMGILHRDSGEYEVVPVATLATFRNTWLPACKQLGLEWVPLFAGGALTTVPTGLIPQIIAELERLKSWAEMRPDGDYLAERCAGILAAFRRTDPMACRYDFG